jgi:hypothetical protein
LSGSLGFFLLRVFLIIENKFSNAGYHNNNKINNGEIYLSKDKLILDKLINSYPTRKLNKKVPESPK